MNIIDRVRTDFESLPLSEQAEIRAAAQNYAGAFGRLLPYEQTAIKRHCQNIVALDLRRRYGEPTEPVAEPTLALPELAKPQPNPKFTDAQKAMMYGQLNAGRKEVKYIATRKVVMEIMADGKPKTALELAAALGRPGDHHYARAVAKRLLDKGLIKLAKRRVDYHSQPINVYVLPSQERSK